MSQLKFRGLVRVMNQVRAKLSAGIAPHEVGAFRDEVDTAVRSVERG